jgi:hypothetical protein
MHATVMDRFLSAPTVRHNATTENGTGWSGRVRRTASRGGPCGDCRFRHALVTGVRSDGAPAYGAR